MYRRIGATLGMLISLTLPAAAEEPAETAGRCAVALADAMRLHGEYADVLDGKRFVAFRQNKPTPALLDYHRTLCPKIRKAGVFHELECAVGIALLPPELGEAAKGAREANLSIIKLCDSQFPAKPLSNAAYQAEFDRQLRRKHYPDSVTGHCNGETVAFSAAFVPFPKGAFGFYSHHGLTDEAFARRNTELKAAGFRQGWQQRVECGGRGYNQGTWTKP